jgi:hypothetical protein
MHRDHVYLENAQNSCVLQEPEASFEDPDGKAHHEYDSMPPETLAKLSKVARSFLMDLVDHSDAAIDRSVDV